MMYVFTAAAAAVDSLKIPTQSYHLFVKKQDKSFMLVYFLLCHKFNSSGFVQFVYTISPFVFIPTLFIRLLV